MSRFLPGWFVGSLAFVALVINTLVCLPLLLVIVLVRIVLPVPSVVDAARRAAENIATTWIEVNVLGLKIAGHIDWDVTDHTVLARDASSLSWRTTAQRSTSWSCSGSSSTASRWSSSS